MAKTKIATEGMLANMQPNAMVYRGYTTNLDTIRTPGIYITQQSTICENPPDLGGELWKYGIVEVFVRGQVIFERLTCEGGAAMRFISGDTPRPWKSLT